MKQRLILIAFGFAALTILSIGLSAQERVKNEPASPDEIITSEQQLARQFADFQDMLLRLKQKLARGNAEEKKRAETLDKVLEACKDFAINQEFAKMIQMMRGAKLTKTQDVGELVNQSDVIAKRLRDVLDMLRNTNVDLSKDRQELKAFLEKLQKIIDDQRRVQAITDLNKTDPMELAKNQNKVTNTTTDLNKKIADYLNKDKKDGKDGKGGEASKGNDKDAGKGEGKKGESKDAGKDGKAQGEAKDGGKETKGNKGEAKPGQDPKESKAGDPKSGAKPGDSKGKEGAPKGSAKESKDSKSGEGQPGASKENKGDPKGGAEAKGAAKKDGKEGAPAGNAKPGDDKKKAGNQGDKPDSKAKPGGEKGNPDAKPGAKESKAGPMDAKPGDAKPGDAKAGDAKPGDAKPGDAKAGDAKPGSPSPPMAGQPPPQPPQAGQKPGDSPPSPAKPGDKQNDDIAKANKRIEEAGYPQSKAEDEIKKKNNPKASGDQKDAITKLEQAKKDLERLLQQMREEEMERVLAALQARCEKMLLMQQRVLAGTVDIDKAIARNNPKKANRENQIASNKLSDEEKDIVQEANKCIDILKSEGTAVAFPEVFQQIRDDMIHVQRRLELTDVADTTQGIERDIIDTLKEMIEALKDAKKEMDDSKSKPGKAGKPGQKGDEKLIKLIQELKMVRSLQKRINDRTTREGARNPGEQANEPQVIRELRNLSERQLRLQETIRRIANGDNK